LESEIIEASVPVHIRRVVTGNDPVGSAGIAMDAAPPRTDAFNSIPGLVSRMIWATSNESSVPFDGVDPTSQVTSLVPAPGETRMLVLTFPPDTVFMSPDFDPAVAMAENLAVSPGLAERFEPDGKHTTPTIDYGIVLDGEIWLELDNGVETCLTPFDVFVQNGTRHAWRNKSDRPATFAVVLIGAAVSAPASPA
jgi:hypothetical protein